MKATSIKKALAGGAVAATSIVLISFPQLLSTVGTLATVRRFL